MERLASSMLAPQKTRRGAFTTLEQLSAQTAEAADGLGLGAEFFQVLGQR